MKKILLTLVNIISVAIILFSVLILLTVVMSRGQEPPNFGGVMVFRVVTGSMEPTLPVDTLLLVRETSPEKIETGDIISFHSQDPKLAGVIVTHRVAAVEGDGGEIAFITRGDANAVDDAYPVASGDVLGKVIFSSPLLGKAVGLTADPKVFFPFLIGPILVMLLANLAGTVRTAGRLAKEEEAAMREALGQNPPDDKEKKE